LSSNTGKIFLNYIYIYIYIYIFSLLFCIYISAKLSMLYVWYKILSFLNLHLHSHQKSIYSFVFRFKNQVYQLETCDQILRSFSDVITSCTCLYFLLIISFVLLSFIHIWNLLLFILCNFYSFRLRDLLNFCYSFFTIVTKIRSFFKKIKTFVHAYIFNIHAWINLTFILYCF